MLIRCIANNLEDILSSCSPRQALEVVQIVPQKAPISIGCDYVVYAITIYFGIQWYYICDDDYEDRLAYPMAYPSHFFEIIDKKWSSLWSDDLFSPQLEYSVLSFKEWANEERFYELLLDGNPRECDLFQKHKILIDLEFSRPSISLYAEQLDENWLMCPKCIDAWQLKEAYLEGMLVECPHCNTLLLRPLEKGLLQ